MSRLVRSVLAGAFMVTAAVVLNSPAHAQSSIPPSAPPALDVSHPTVTGILVAKPVQGEGNIPAACRDRDQASINSAVLQQRGLVICTGEGKLVLLQLSKDTGIYARYWGRYSVGYLRDGDFVRAWGVLKDNGYLLDPTYAVQDPDLQEAYTDSQDYITGHDANRLTLDVLASDPHGPVAGIIHANRGGAMHITLCNGKAGTWADLTAGKTIDITRSVYNRRLHVYLDTDTVRVVSCP